MTRKDYVFLANALRCEIEEAEGQYETIGAEAVRKFAESLAGRLAIENPAFDRRRFLTACGIS